MRRRRLHRRERKLRNKKIIIASICLICIMSVGFAAFQTNLSLNAKGNIKEKYFTVNFKTQLLENENFENGLDEWVFGYNLNNASITLDTDVTYNGYNTVRIQEKKADGAYFNGIWQVVNAVYDASKTYQFMSKLYRDSDNSYGNLTNQLRMYGPMGKDGISYENTTWLIFKETNTTTIEITSNNLSDKTWTTYIGNSNSFAGTYSNIVNEIYSFRIDYDATTGITTPSTVWFASPRLYEIETKEIKGYKAIGTLPTATKEGYTFIGWYTEEYGGEKIDESTIIKEDTDLYAHFSAN